MKLTLAIPTYNRARYLDVLLTSIADQAQPHLNELEIIVSDNASTDDTSAVITRHALKMPITHIRQAENIGSDLNFAGLFAGARGDYVWIIGDDDFLLPNALRAVIDTINATAPGIIFVTPVGFASELDARAYPNNVVEVWTLGREIFAERVNIRLTFISSLIVNKAALGGRVTTEGMVDLARSGSCLTQYGWVLPALLTDRPLVYIPTCLVAAKQGERGGYALFKVFIENSNRVMAMYFSRHPELIRKINNRALMRFFPNRIVRGKLNPEMLSESNRDVASLFHVHYNGNIWYWLLVWPLLKSRPPLRYFVRVYQLIFLLFLEMVLWAKIHSTGGKIRFRYAP